MSDAPQWTDETARWYAEKYGDWPTTRAFVDAAVFGASDTVLDIGCGTGSALRAVAAVVPAGRLIGVDPSPEMARIARAQVAASGSADRIEILRCGAEALELGDSQVDTAYALSTVYHWSDVPAGLAEALRVLRPGGRLLVIEEDVHGTGGYPDPAAILGLLEAAGFVGLGHERRDFGDDIRAVLIRARKPEA